MSENEIKFSFLVFTLVVGCWCSTCHCTLTAAVSFCSSSGALSGAMAGTWSPAYRSTITCSRIRAIISFIVLSSQHSFT